MKYAADSRRLTTHPRRKARLERTLDRKETELSLDVYEDDREKRRKRRVAEEIHVLKERISSGR